MLIETATRAFNEIRNTQHGGLLRDLVRAAVNYAHVRAEWYLADQEQRANTNQARTAAHNAFIDSFNILSRQMAKSEESIAWRELLGSDRREIGDFACFIALFVGLVAR